MNFLSTFLASRAGRVTRHAISIALVAGFAASVDWRQLGGLRGHFDWPLVLGATALAGLAYPLLAWRWWLLLRAQGLGLPLDWAHRVTWIGTFYNAFLLGGLGGDAARAFYVCRDEPQRRAGGLAATLIDRVMGLVVLLSIAAGALLAKTGALSREPGLRWLFVGALAGSLVGAIAALWLLRTTPASWPLRLRRWIGEQRLPQITALLDSTRAAHRTMLAALAISYAVWLVDFVSIWLLALAVGLPLPFVETCIASAVAYAATVLPISVGGHGVREGALLAVLGLFGLIAATGLERDRALLLAVGVWAITVGWSLVGGAVLLAASPPPARAA
ncbi:MAG: flippase-like domain-containing protein [Opitutae bacterium]|nr:flippase-like domain-containing protein [Opitutae bacterium]